MARKKNHRSSRYHQKNFSFTEHRAATNIMSAFSRLAFSLSTFFLLQPFSLTHSFTSSRQWHSATSASSYNSRHHERIRRTFRPPHSSTASTLSMHMGHSHSHNHSHNHHNHHSNIATQSRRVQLSCATSFIVLLLAAPWCRSATNAAWVGLSSGIAAYTMVPPVWVRMRAWMKGITRHRPRYEPRRNAADRVTVLG